MELEEEWNQKRIKEDEEMANEQKMKAFLKRINSTGKRIQVFIDPRSSKFRKNFGVVNENINQIRNADPNLSALSKVFPGINKREKPKKIGEVQKSLTNADILGEILKISNVNQFMKGEEHKI